VEGSALSKDHDYYVYLVASRTHVLYCGVTNSIRRRLGEHRDATYPGFSATYRCTRLVWFEHFQYVLNAIDREKQIKGWRREKKIRLIEKENPTWADLSDHWNGKADPSTPVGMTIAALPGLGEDK
jgi:putative endonuclease